MFVIACHLLHLVTVVGLWDKIQTRAYTRYGGTNESGQPFLGAVSSHDEHQTDVSGFAETPSVPITNLGRSTCMSRSCKMLRASVGEAASRVDLVRPVHLTNIATESRVSIWYPGSH
jgi:hypothetical protein